MLEDTLEPASVKVLGRYPQSLLKAIDAAMAPRPEQRPQTVAKWREMFGFNAQESQPEHPADISLNPPPPSPPRFGWFELNRGPAVLGGFAPVYKVKNRTQRVEEGSDMRMHGDGQRKLAE